MKTKVSIDFETFSVVSLPTVGTSVYSRHESTEVLMAAYAFDDGPILQWVPAEGEPMPVDLEEAYEEAEQETSQVEFWAWNVPFELNVTRNTMRRKTLTRNWRDTMVAAMHCSLPGKLEKAGEIIKLPMEQQKNRRGKALMRKFSFPAKPTKTKPDRTRNYWFEYHEDWQEYLSYNRSDVVAERGIRKRLGNYMMPDYEWQNWLLDQAINERGLPINLNMVRNAIALYEEGYNSGTDEMREITGLANPNSLTQLLPWLQDNGYMFDDCKKGHIERAKMAFEVKPEHWTEPQWEAYQQNVNLYDVLTIRQEVSRSSIKKYYALERATDQEDGRLRYTLQFNGAPRTGREAGRIFQPQNLLRPVKAVEEAQEALAYAIEHLSGSELRLVFGNLFDALASGLRPTLQAPDGYVFIVSDLNAIENRVLGWLADCDKILEVFRLKRDPYIAFASYLYGIPYEELYHEYKVLKIGTNRQIAKPGTLGSGYGMGAGHIIVNNSTGEIEATGLLGYAWGMGVKSFTEADAKHSIDTFRREFKEVKDYWYALEGCAIRAVRTGKEQNLGPIGFDMKGPFLRMILPSSRPLYYLRPKVMACQTPWGATKMQLTYENQDERKQWARTKTTGGKLVENADQATSRDILWHGLRNAEKENLQVVLHVHDELVALSTEDRAEEELKVLVQCMEDQPSWAKTLPLGTGSHITKCYKKD